MLATTNEINNPLAMRPTRAGARRPRVPCLEIPNRATTARTKPGTRRQSAADAIAAMVGRARVCPPSIKSAQATMVMMGQMQLSRAA